MAKRTNSRVKAGPPRLPVPETHVPDGTVLYDGVCVLCSSWFRFVAAHDPEARFRFTQIQGAYGRWLATRLGIDPDNPQTNAVVLDGRAYVRSDSALQVLRRLPGWSWIGLALAVPRPLRDWLYDRIASNRYRLFGRTETCMVPDREMMRHVLPETTPLPEIVPRPETGPWPESGPRPETATWPETTPGGDDILHG